MSKYIDAEKLIAEIERRKDKYDPHWTNAGRELEELISFTKSLQQEDASKMEQPEVDFNEEVERFAKECGYPSAATIDFQFARHFYELGLNARKEK